MKTRLSNKNEWHIEKERYLELTHFCRQYPDWTRGLHAVEGLMKEYKDPNVSHNKYIFSDPTEKYAILRANYSKKIDLVRTVAKQADSELWEYILIGVTQNCSYDRLWTKFGIPCSRGTYYDRYHKFFYLLDKARD